MHASYAERVLICERKVVGNLLTFESAALWDVLKDRLENSSFENRECEDSYQQV